MNKKSLFRKIVARSVLLGLQAGAALSFATGFFFMLSVGFWAIAIGVGDGCAIGAALGLVNGLLLAGLICRFFFPYSNTQSSALQRVTQTGSIAVSLLVVALIALFARVVVGADLSFIGKFLALAVPLVGAAAWWASRRVGIWYEALSAAVSPAATQQGLADSTREPSTQSGTEDQMAPD